MTPQARALEGIFDLYNVAEHVTRLSENARVSTENGDFERALQHLDDAKESADRVTYMLREAVRIVGLAKAEGDAA